MGLKLPPDQLALYQGIDEILWRDWDPIGVSNLENPPRDEYYAYVPHVFQLAMKRGTTDEIAESLSQIVREQMGLASPIQHALLTAQKIRALKSRLIPE
jgi:hypothetical protein